MKNIFKLLSVMFVAGAMMTMVSCGDENQTTGDGETTYTVSAKANNNLYGTVTITPAKSAYNTGDTVVLKATANTSYKFVNWSDDVVEAERTIVIANENISLTANFEELPQSVYTITFNGNSWNAANWECYDHSDENYMTIYAYKTANSEEDINLVGYLQTIAGTYDYETSQGDYMNYYDPSAIWVDENNVLGQGAGVGYYKYQVDKTTFQEQIVAIDLNARTLTANWSEDCFDIEYYVSHNGDYGTMLPLQGAIQNISWTWSTSKANTRK